MENLRGRGLVDYLKDPSIGKKRLVSLPDRKTGTLGSGRPGVTTTFVGEIAGVDDWWACWTNFIFEQAVYKKIKPHPEKYHAELTPQEIELSTSLQLLHLALFDACMIFVMGRVYPSWMNVKRQLVTGVVAG